MRKQLDAYLDVADAEIQQFQASFAMLESYDRCGASKEELLKSYALSMKMMRKSHSTCSLKGASFRSKMHENE